MEQILLGSLHYRSCARLSAVVYHALLSRGKDGVYYTIPSSTPPPPPPRTCSLRKNSPYFATPPLVSREVTSEKRAQKFPTDDALHPDLGSVSFLRKVCFNQSEARYPDLVGKASSKWNFCARFSGKPMIASRNSDFLFVQAFELGLVWPLKCDGFDSMSGCCITLWNKILFELWQKL